MTTIKPDLAALKSAAATQQVFGSATVRELIEYAEGLEADVGRLTEALGPDASGRELSELLSTASVMLEGYGGGPVADCLRIKATEIEASR